MALIEAHVAVAHDTPFPRDRIVNTLHFNHTALTLAPTDYDSLANDLIGIWEGNWVDAGQPPEIKVSLYNLDDPKPRAPVSVQIAHPASSPASQCPREVALCLSFYHDFNRPRNRGRIYLCPAARGLSALPAKPADALCNQALAMATAFAALGGSNVKWCVFSRMDNQHKPVTHAYVDNEWDTVRSRGLRATSRVAATTGD